MKAVGRSLLKMPFVQGVLASLIAWWLRFVFFTNKKTMHWPESAQPYFSGEKPAIFCFWHGRMIMHQFINPPGRTMKVLISHHRDGALITTILARFGVGVVRGSSNKGGAEALLGLRQEAASGCNISITPDGPRGPAYVAAPGAAHLAMVTGLPIIATSFSATRARRMRSWDGFLLPHPFGKIIFTAAEPFFVAQQEDSNHITVASEQLGVTLNAIMQQGDQLAGMNNA